MRETRTGHDLLNGDIVEAMAIEKPSRTLNDVFSYFRAVTNRIGHKVSSVVRCGSMA
jgi:hypothetical protein